MNGFLSNLLLFLGIIVIVISFIFTFIAVISRGNQLVIIILCVVGIMNGCIAIAIAEILSYLRDKKNFSKELQN